MSNDSSHSMPWFSEDSYNRVLAATHLEDSQPDFFYSPARTFIYRVYRPPQRSITPRPITPEFVGDFDQCDAQRIVYSPWSPPALRDSAFGYSELTPSEDSANLLIARVTN